MASKKWDYYKVARGTALTPSKASRGAFRGLVHGTKGVAKQAEFFKVERKGSFFGTLLAFTGKCLAAVVAVGLVVALAALLISAIATGIASGLASVAEAISAASSYLVIGVSVAAAIAAVGVSVKIAKSIARSRSRRRIRAAERAERASARERAAVETAAQHATWTAQAAAVARAQATPPDWYPDPSDPAQVRYWDGASWTYHVRQPPAATSTPAGWYPAPSDPSQLRYWNGTIWTDHWMPQGTAVAQHAPVRQHPSQSDRIAMSSAEWQSTVRAWMAAGAVEQELWRRLSSAQINDADQLTLEAQRRMEQLTAEQGSQKVRLMLEANPGLRDELGVSDFLSFILNSVAPLDQRARVSISQANDGKTHGDPSGLV